MANSNRAICVRCLSARFAKWRQRLKMLLHTNLFNSRCDLFVLVSYDIVDNKKRTKLAKHLCNYGQRVQYSVFECKLDEQQIKKMKKEALEFIDLEKDSLRIYKYCKDCQNKVESFGIKRGFEDEDGAIVV